MTCPGCKARPGQRRESSHGLLQLLASLLFLSHCTFRSQVSLFFKHTDCIPTSGPLHMLLPRSRQKHTMRPPTPF